MRIPREVRVEVGGGDPFGRGDHPSLSWLLPDHATHQRGYRIVTDDGFDSGRVLTASQSYVQVPVYDVSRRHCSARVQVWTDQGESGWSDPVPLGSGLLEESDWTTPWVGVDDSHVEGRPAHWLRAVVDVVDPEGALLHLTALGLYEVFLNGVRVGDEELAPGYTQYLRRVVYGSHDLGRLLRPGLNVVAVLLADGWYRGAVGVRRATDEFGRRLALRAQLEVPRGHGWDVVDATWRTAPSHVVAADLIGGQREDRRRVDRTVHQESYDDTGWAPAVPVAVTARIVRAVSPPIRRVAEIRPVSVTPLVGTEVQIVDLGQNINGWLRLSDLGPSGTQLTLRHGEHLDATGDLTTTHLDVDLPFLPHPLPLGQVDVVVSSGVVGDVFEPRLTTHGFRYARIEGLPHLLDSEDVTGVVVHSDVRRTGWFDCSDDRLNRLHEAAVWSLRDNLCGIPTDCPQRERAGWTGDWQVFAPTAAYLYDVLGLTRSWLRDVALDQREDGCVANMSPCPPGEGFGSPMAFLNGSAGWGDVVVSTPWSLYEAYGDERLLAESWDSLRAWVDYCARCAASGRHPSRAEARPEAAAHERYLWDTGFHWGEWLEPGAAIEDFAAFVGSDTSEVATAYLHRSARTAADIGELIGADAEIVGRYRTVAAGARDAWVAEFVLDGALRVQSQAAHVRALAFDLVEDALRPAVATRLAELVAEAGGHLTTGFLSTGLLLPALAENGQLDTAFALLRQDTEPSWLTMIDRGATTVWERWNGVDADGVAHESLNHYSKGAVISFLHHHVAGLQATSPGYRTFRVDPQSGGGLTWARTSHDSPYGRISVSWESRAGGRRLEVTVPGGTAAEVVLPDGTIALVGPGSHAWSHAMRGSRT